MSYVALLSVYVIEICYLSVKQYQIREDCKVRLNIFSTHNKNNAFPTMDPDFRRSLRSLSVPGKCSFPFICKF